MVRSWCSLLYFSVHLFIYSSIHLSIYSSTYLFLYSSTYLCLYSSTYLFLYSSNHQSIYSSCSFIVFIYCKIKKYIDKRVHIHTPVPGQRRGPRETLWWASGAPPAPRSSWPAPAGRCSPPNIQRHVFTTSVFTTSVFTTSATIFLACSGG